MLFRSDTPAGATAGCSGNAAGYTSLTQAVQVYAAKLGSVLYEAIGQALVSDAGLTAIWTAINASPWCQGCQGGHYPEALYGALGTPPDQTPAPPPITIKQTPVEAQHGISASNPYGDLESYGVAPLSLDGWSHLQDAVNTTFRERLNQSQAHRSRAWEALARG